MESPMLKNMMIVLGLVAGLTACMSPYGYSGYGNTGYGYDGHSNAGYGYNGLGNNGLGYNGYGLQF
jgi:hypothetical protein